MKKCGKPIKKECLLESVGFFFQWNNFKRIKLQHCTATLEPTPEAALHPRPEPRVFDSPKPIKQSKRKISTKF